MSYIIDNTGATLYHNGQTVTVERSNTNWAKLMELLANGDMEGAMEIAQPVRAAVAALKSAGGDVLVDLDAGVVTYKGEEVENYAVSALLSLAREGVPVQPVVNFLERLMQNPSFKSRRDCYRFIEAGKLPLTPKGTFLAYKKVREDYTDCHTGTVDNNVGQQPWMNREQVDDDSNNTCSYGYHVCSRAYLTSFSGQRLMMVEVDPANVVSVPTDYRDSKARVNTYLVVDELPMTDQPPKFSKPVTESTKHEFIYDADGYDVDGYDSDGYDSEGYDRDGYDRDGSDRDGYDSDGYDSEGYDREDYDRDGYDRDGYDSDGYDENNYDRDGDFGFDR